MSAGRSYFDQIKNSVRTIRACKNEEIKNNVKLTRKARSSNI